MIVLKCTSMKHSCWLRMAQTCRRPCRYWLTRQHPTTCPSLARLGNTQCCICQHRAYDTAGSQQPGHTTVKRKVALHFGYLGTGYQGARRFLAGIHGYLAEANSLPTIQLPSLSHSSLLMLRLSRLMPLGSPEPLAGLQAHHGVENVHTLEDELLKAVHAAGGVLSSNLDKPHRLDMSRSSRTDKGVHSLSTVSDLAWTAWRKLFQSFWLDLCLF